MQRNFCQSANVITESENEVLLKQQLRITDQDIHENPDINKEYNRDENTETGTENFFAYSDGKKDKETLGLFYLNMISLPEDLKESLSVFYKSRSYVLLLYCKLVPIIVVINIVYDFLR